MARYSGASLVVRFITPTATANWSSDYRSLDVNETADTIDSSAGSDTYKNSLAGQVSTSWSTEYLPQTAGTALYSQVAPQASGTLEWSPEGTAGGKQKFTAPAVILNRNLTAGYSAVTTVKLSGQITGAITQASW